MAKKTKVQTMTIEEIAYYKDLLLEKLKEIVGDVSCLEENVFQGGGELSSMPVHMADIGSDSFEQEFSLGLMAEEKKMIKEIIEALQRIEEGTFGICEGLNIPIEQPRLEAIPWTRYSLEYARQQEKGRGNHFSKRPIDIQREDPDTDNDDDDDDNEDDILEAEDNSFEDDIEEEE